MLEARPSNFLTEVQPDGHDMNKLLARTLRVIFLLLLSTGATVAQQRPDFKLQAVANGLGVPWALCFLAEDQLLISERAGSLKLLNRADSSIDMIQGIPPVYANGQGGLLDVAVPRPYSPGGWIYFTYSREINGDAATTLARARLQGLQLVDWTNLLVSRSRSGSGQHFGSRIAFDGEGHVFFSVGDRGHRPNGQNLKTHAGSILRLNLDGRVPADNPFVGRAGALPEIWSYGHRNPQGLWFDRETGRLWSIEHGPRGGDEINLIRKGRNYGWPVVSHGKEYWGPLAVGEGTEKPGMEKAIKVYIPSIAPGSLALYRGKAFPAWRGNLFAGALKLRHLNRVVLDEQGKALAEQRLLGDFGERIRALAVSPNGLIYLSTDSGKIWRLVPG